jgi:hypothetical protein
MAIEEFNLTLCPPGGLSFDIVGAAIEAPRSVSGITGAVDFSGGGFVTAKYTKISLGNRNGDALRYWSRLGALLAGGVQPIIVPLLTDFIAPAFTGLALPATFGDAATFGDGSTFAQSPIGAWAGADAKLAAGLMSIKLQAGCVLQGGEWFSVLHPALHHRVYRIRRIDAVSAADGDGAVTYTAAIRPTLRQAIAAGDTLEFVRPKCLMRLAPGASLPFEAEGYWISKPEVSFLEYPTVPVT